MFRWLIAGEMSTDAAFVAHVDIIPSYRLHLSDMATGLLDAADIPHPQGKTRNQFSVDRFETQVDKGKYQTQVYDEYAPLRKVYETAIRLCYSNVLPRPIIKYQGRLWNKLHRYIAAGIAYAATSGAPNAPTVEQVVKMVEDGAYVCTTLYNSLLRDANAVVAYKAGYPEMAARGREGAIPPR